MKNVMFSTRRMTALVIALFCFSAGASAQQLFSPMSTMGKSKLKPEALGVLQKCRQMERYSKVVPVAFQSLEEVLNDRSIEIALEEGGTPLKFDLETIEFTSNENWYIYGKLSREFGQRGEVMLRARDGEKFGTVDVGGEFFRLDALDQEYSVLLKQSEEFGSEEVEMNCSDAERQPVGAFPESNIEVGARTTNNCKVRVLMLYTNAANNFVTNRMNHAQSHIDQINQVLNNSGVSTGELRFQLASAQPIGLDEQNETSSNLLWDLSVDPVVANYRSIYQADLVCLVVDHNITNFGSVAGRAYTAHNAGWGFCLIRELNSLNLKLFPHEIGHNMGCGHEDGASTNFRRAYEFDAFIYSPFPGIPSEYEHFRTLMNRVARTTNMLNYSNPDVNKWLTPTGTPLNNNARQLKENACYVAGFESEPSTLVASIAGPAVACPGVGVKCFYGSASGGTSGFINYQWAYSASGFSFTNFGTGSTPCLNMSNFPNSLTVTIRLTVTAGTETTTAFHTLQVSSNSPGGCLGFGKADSGLGLTLGVHPNPVENESVILLELPEAERVELSLYDLAGKHLLTILDKELVAGEHQIPFGVGQLPSGTYLMEMKTHDSRIHQRLVIAH